MKTEDAGAPLQVPGDATEWVTVDTRRGSLVHWLFDRRRADGRPTLPGVVLFCVAALVGYLPIVIAVWLGGLPLVHPRGGVTLPLFYDSNTAWMFLVSLPTLLLLTVRDQRVLADALCQAQGEGVIRAHDGAAATLKSGYAIKFMKWNVWFQIIGLGVGLTVAVLNYRLMSDPGLGAWGSAVGVMQPAGYILLVLFVPFYAIATIYLLRSAGIVFLLSALVRHADMDMLPLHPDGCGGLRPMGQLGLRNQYALSVIGINLVLLVYVTQTYLRHGPLLQFLVGLGVGAYLILGPLAFLGPLLPFRGGMLDAKKRLLGPVAKRLRKELARVERNIATGEVTKSDEELIDRLQKLGVMIDSLPVWPFDAGTLRRFLTAYVLPVVGAIGLPLFDILIRAKFHLQ